MRKAAVPALVVIIFIAFGVIIVATIIVWGAQMYSQIVHGKCWADMERAVSDVKSDLGGLTVGQSAYRKVTVGECVGAVVIFNANRDSASEISYPRGLENYSAIVDEKCPKFSGYRSYALILPWKTVKEEIQKDQSLWSRIKEKFTLKFYQDWYKEMKQDMRLLKPGCVGFEGEFENPAYYMPSELATPGALLNEKDVTECYELGKVSSTNSQGFAFRLNLAADAKCPEKS